MDFAALTTRQLLHAHGALMDELRRRDVMRSANNPIGDLAELLFCRAFGWAREGNSAAGFDARDAAGMRYQIKARRITEAPGSRQLSAIRNLASDPFDHLAAVLFDRDFDIHRAALVPIAVVKAAVRRSSHTNSDVLHLRDELWQHADVRDVTDTLRAAVGSL